MDKVQKARRIVQAVVFLGMFIVPVLNLLEIYFIRGTFISMDIGSLSVADPAMVLQTAFSPAGLSVALLGSVVIPIALVLLLGRVWCSWMCPYITCMEWMERIPFFKKRLQAQQSKIADSKGLRRVLALRYLIFILLLAFVAISGVPLLHLISPPAVMSTQALLLIKASVTVEILFILLIILAEFFISYRFVCRYLCPTGTCLSLLTNNKALHVDFTGTCINCKKCSRVCPMGLNPLKDTYSRMCFNCGKCIDSCPDETKPLRWKIL